MRGDAESHTEAPLQLVLNSQVHKMPGSGGISQPSSCATPEQMVGTRAEWPGWQPVAVEGLCPSHRAERDRQRLGPLDAGADSFGLWRCVVS